MKRLLATLGLCILLSTTAAAWAGGAPASTEGVLIAQAESQDAGAAAEPAAEAQTAEHEAAAGEHAAEGGHGGEHLGESLPLFSVLPFVGILLSIALFPLFAPHFWHHHFPKVSAFWALLLALPFLAAYGGEAVHSILHIYILDYIPFIILLWSLYTISGGILLRGSIVGTPVVNTGMLFVGTMLASWMGTTGAAMLMIRPFLRANKARKNRTFMVCFFIFLVANIGGSLTPLGDPPLFLGFLHGVPFFWTLHIFPHMMACVAILLVVYFIMDSYYYKQEDLSALLNAENKQPVRLAGAFNFLFLLGVIAAILMSGYLSLGEISILGIPVGIESLMRDVILVAMGGLSLALTPRDLREENEFSWFPIQEVAYLFAGIFMTMIPCLAILKAGTAGHAAPLINAVREPIHFFWITGALSSFLDNAPTYLTFFTTALGRFYPGLPEAEAVPKLIVDNVLYLEAISAGAVFFGAMTYIGNAPNFMVRSIAEEAGTPMPSFFGYMFRYSLIFLAPLFVVITFIFFM
ncbi:MAG: sodium:proton antiporter [bacterium]|nr:sodium:proton antiporter [bacterium]